jgi:hypothetical protein
VSSLFRVFAPFALVAVAGPATAQGIAPARTDEIIAGAQSCAAATAPTGIDEARLKSDGWGKGAVSANGKALPTSMAFYGNGPLVLMFNRNGAKPICIVTGRLPSAADFPKLQAAFASAYGAPVKDDGKGAQIFITPDHRIMQLAFTGTEQMPAVRVGVGPVF